MQVCAYTTAPQVAAENLRHGQCVFKPSSGYTHGLIGAATAPKGQKPIVTKQDCCDACLANHKCSKFAFQPDSAQCQLFEPMAEEYSTDGLISGILQGHTWCPPSPCTSH